MFIFSTLKFNLMTSYFKVHLLKVHVEYILNEAQKNKSILVITFAKFEYISNTVNVVGYYFSLG